MPIPKKVKIVEVSPRDGLQHEPHLVPKQIKLELIERLTSTGLTAIEATSFVSAKWVPQLADHNEVYSAIKKHPGINYPVLVPNLKGLANALQVGVKEIAAFSAASDTFSRKNTNASIAESLARYAEVIPEAKKHNIKVRGYISCALGCPYEGKISPQAVLYVAERLWQLGCYEIALGDTIGIGTAGEAIKLIETIATKIPMHAIAVHFHDTYGQALANIYAVLERGIATVDSSVAGLGGCPFAPGASGNVATEDVVYMLHGSGIETGVDLNALCATGKFITEYLGIPSRSKVAQALAVKRDCRNV